MYANWTYSDYNIHIFDRFNIIIYKRASLACAARLADTLYPPEAPFGRLWSPLINYMGDNISKYACPTVIIYYRTKNHQIYQFLQF